MTELHSGSMYLKYLACRLTYDEDSESKLKNSVPEFFFSADMGALLL